MPSFRPHLEELLPRENPSGGHADLGHVAAHYRVLHADQEMAFRIETEATAHIVGSRLEVRGLLHPVDAHITAGGHERVVHLTPGDSSIDIGEAADVNFTDLNENTGHIPAHDLEAVELAIATYGVPLHEVQELVHSYLEDQERQHKLLHALHGGHGGHEEHAAHVPHAEHTHDHPPHAEHKHDEHHHHHHHEHEHDETEHHDEKPHDENPQTSSGLLDAEALLRHGRRPHKQNGRHADHSRQAEGPPNEDRQDHGAPAPGGHKAQEAPAPRPLRQTADADMQVDDDADGILWGVDIGKAPVTSASPAPVRDADTSPSASALEHIAVAGIATGAAAHAATPRGRSLWKKVFGLRRWFVRS